MRGTTKFAALAALILVATSAPTGTAATTQTYEDGDFAPADWDSVPVGPAGGATSLARQPNGGVPGAYAEVTTTAAAGAAALWGFHINTTAVYDTSTLGGIDTVNYSESSRSSGGVIQGIHPALRQAGKLYAHITALITTANPAAWERNDVFGMSEASFRTQASSSDHPDFSPTGGPIEFGFMRAVSAELDRKGHIDNWKVTVNPPPGVNLPPEIRAESHTTIQFSAAGGGGTDVTDQVVSHAPADVTDLSEASGSAGDNSNVVNGGSQARAGLAGGLGARSGASTGIGAGFVESIRSTSLASHRRVFYAEWNGSGPPPTNLQLSLTVGAHGTLGLRDLGFDNPSPPAADDVFAKGRARVRLITTSNGTSTPFDESVTLLFGSTSATPLWTAHVSPGADAQGRPITTLSYNNTFPGLLSVPHSEEFAIEYLLETEAFVAARAPQWGAFADFSDTLTLVVATDTADMELVEVFPDLDPTEPTAVTGKRLTKLAKFFKEKKKDETAELLLGDGTWALLVDRRRRLAGTFTVKDKRGNKLLLTLDDASLETLLGGLGFITPGESENLGFLAVALKAGKVPKLLVAKNRKGTKVKVKVKIKLAVTSEDVTKNGVYSLSLKGALPALPAE